MKRHLCQALLVVISLASTNLLHGQTGNPTTKDPKAKPPEKGTVREIRQGGYVEKLDPRIDFKDRLPRIPPRSPKEALRVFHLVPGYRLELVASEPLICSPVDAVFDENGRLYVAEMVAYAENNSSAFGSPQSRITMLEDTDGDGIFDKSTVFCDKLVWPTGVACFDGGIFVTAAPDLLYCRDTTGKGKADLREVVLTGFGLSNPNAVPNSLRWSFDHRLHGMPSLSGGTLRAVRWEKSKKTTEKGNPLRGRDFSIDPRTGEVRMESGGSQFGMAYDDWGCKFQSSNSAPIEMVMYEDHYLARNPALAAPAARINIWNYGMAVYRTSPPEPWRVLRTELRISGSFSGPVEGGGSPVGYFTGACGLFMPRNSAWPGADCDDGFVGEGSSNLVHRMRLKPNGVAYTAYRVDEKCDFLTSEDIWFRPVQFTNGPDGGLYVIDMYRECYEHPDAVPPSAKKYMDLSSGKDRGRIYRIVPEGFKRLPPIRMGTLPTSELVPLLAHPNAWHRETAARLIFERQDRKVTGALTKLAAESSSPLGRMHAMYALDGLGALEPAVVLPRLEDKHPRVRENAVRLSEKVLAKSPEVRARLCAMTADPDMRVRYQLAFSLGDVPGAAATAALGKIAAQDPEDTWVRLAVFSSCFGRAGELLSNLVADKGFQQKPASRAFLEGLAEQAGLQLRQDQIAHVLKITESLSDKNPLAQTLVRGLSRGLAKSGSSLQRQALGTGRAKKMLQDILTQAQSTAVDEKQPIKSRLEAIHSLALASWSQIGQTMPVLLDSRQPKELQLAALETLGRFSDSGVPSTIIAAWSRFSPAVRSEATEVLFSRRDWLPLFLDAVGKQKILVSQIPPARIDLLLKHPNVDLRKQAQAILGSETLSRRKDVIASYSDVLKMKGDYAHGKAVFKRDCAVCHRLENVGFDLGLPLASVQNKGAEFLLHNILDPNLQVLPDYINYMVVTLDGRTITGMIASETATSITLRRQEEQSDVVLRSNIEEMVSTALSIMPEGLEKNINKQEMADLIEYLMHVK